MYHHQTTNWPQSHLYFVAFKKPDKRLRQPVPSEAPSAALTPSARTDMQIEQDVRNELGMEPSVRAAAIDVAVKGGVVTLKGIVDSDGEQWLIESAVRRIAGVQGLLVQLKVFGSPSAPTDDEIAHDCERVLGTLIPSTDYAIQVLVSNGWVRLVGDVAEGYERRIAESEVSSLLSVHGVNSQVRVRPSVAILDANVSTRSV